MTSSNERLLCLLVKNHGDLEKKLQVRSDLVPGWNIAEGLPQDMKSLWLIPAGAGMLRPACRCRKSS